MKKPYYCLRAEVIKHFTGTEDAYLYCFSPSTPPPSSDFFGYEILRYQFSNPDYARALINSQVFPALALVDYDNISVGRRQMPSKSVLGIEILTPSTWVASQPSFKHSEQDDNYNQLVLSLSFKSWVSKKSVKGAETSLLYPYSIHHTDDSSGLKTQSFYMDFTKANQLISGKSAPLFSYISTTDTVIQGAAVESIESFERQAAPPGFDEFFKGLLTLPKTTRQPPKPPTVNADTTAAGVRG